MNGERRSPCGPTPAIAASPDPAWTSEDEDAILRRAWRDQTR